MKFKKLALTLLSTVTLAACGAATSTSNSGATNTADNETFNVGGNFGLSGAFSAYGTAINDGAALAFKEINEDGGILGKDVNYISVDNKSDATESTTQTARLIDEENISVLVVLIQQVQQKHKSKQRLTQVCQLLHQQRQVTL